MSPGTPDRIARDVATGLDIEFEAGAAMLAQDLGFNHQNELKQWAAKNSDLWGNRYGDCMFEASITGDYAFGLQDMLWQTRQARGVNIIIEHWRCVADRIEARQKENADAS